jgi:hypothetical protein
MIRPHSSGTQDGQAGELLASPLVVKFKGRNGADLPADLRISIVRVQ